MQVVGDLIRGRVRFLLGRLGRLGHLLRLSTALPSCGFGPLAVGFSGRSLGTVGGLGFVFGLPLDAGPLRLHRVGELVGEEAVALLGAGIEFACAEVNVLADGAMRRASPGPPTAEPSG